MHLKRLELSGFKSFAKPTIFEFKTPLTAVVGPNGSGKSNIAESLRFVLGEQSMKTLRSRRGEDLIFNGSKTLARLNRASVSVTFDNARRVLPIDYDEVEIKRVIGRDSASEYFINNSLVRLKDILELLANFHIGASGHHIISQGGTDRILNATPEERRSMVEDALGLKIFEYKRAESERKLKKTKEHIAQAEALRNEIAPHLKFLERQMEKVRRGEALREELKSLSAEYLAREEAYLQKERILISEEEDMPRKELQALDKKIKELEQELRKTGRKDTRDGNVLEETRIMLEKTRREKDGISRELGRLEGLVEFEERALRDIQEAGREDERLSLPRMEFSLFKKNIDQIIKDALQNPSVENLKSALKAIQERCVVFFSSVIEAEDPILDEKRMEQEAKLQKAREQKQEVGKRSMAIEQEEYRLNELYRKLFETLDKEKDAEREIERHLFTLQGQRSGLINRLEFLRIRKEKFKTEEENYRIEAKEAEVLVGKYVLSEEIKKNAAIIPEESRVEQEKRRRALERIKIKLEEIGGGGEEITKEYTETKERDDYLAKEIEDLEKSAETLSRLIDELKEKINIEFKNGVEKINKEFSRYFNILFPGGVAALKIVRMKPRLKKSEISALQTETEMEEENGTEDNSLLAEEGVEIVVSLPHKRIKGLQALSGGERTLTSIALIFAATHVNPPPFLVMDEADAALDETNSRKYGSLLEELSKTTQFIIITHNRETMVRAGVLYGITMGGDGTSRLLSIKLDQAVQMAE